MTPRMGLSPISGPSASYETSAAQSGPSASDETLAALLERDARLPLLTGAPASYETSAPKSIERRPQLPLWPMFPYVSPTSGGWVEMLLSSSPLPAPPLARRRGGVDVLDW